jgi:hypothetical protein
MPGSRGRERQRVGGGGRAIGLRRQSCIEDICEDESEKEEGHREKEKKEGRQQKNSER